MAADANRGMRGPDRWRPVEDSIYKHVADSEDAFDHQVLQAPPSISEPPGLDAAQLPLIPRRHSKQHAPRTKKAHEVGQARPFRVTALQTPLKVRPEIVTRRREQIPATILALQQDIFNVERHKTAKWRDLPHRGKLREALAAHFDNCGYLKKGSELTKWKGDSRLFDQRWWDWVGKHRPSNELQGSQSSPTEISENKGASLQQSALLPQSNFAISDIHPRLRQSHDPGTFIVGLKSPSAAPAPKSLAMDRTSKDTTIVSARDVFSLEQTSALHLLESVEPALPVTHPRNKRTYSRDGLEPKMVKRSKHTEELVNDYSNTNLPSLPSLVPQDFPPPQGRNHPLLPPPQGTPVEQPQAKPIMSLYRFEIFRRIFSRLLGYNAYFGREPVAMEKVRKLVNERLAIGVRKFEDEEVEEALHRLWRVDLIEFPNGREVKRIMQL